MGIGISMSSCSLLKIYSYSNSASSSIGGDDNSHLSSKSMPRRSTDKLLELLLLILCIANMQIKNKQINEKPNFKAVSQTAFLVYSLLETAPIGFRKGKSYS